MHGFEPVPKYESLKVAILKLDAGAIRLNLSIPFSEDKINILSENTNIWERKIPIG